MSRQASVAVVAVASWSSSATDVTVLLVVVVVWRFNLFLLHAWVMTVRDGADRARIPSRSSIMMVLCSVRVRRGLAVLIGWHGSGHRRRWLDLKVRDVDVTARGNASHTLWSAHLLHWLMVVTTRRGRAHIYGRSMGAVGTTVPLGVLSVHMGHRGNGRRVHGGAVPREKFIKLPVAEHQERLLLLLGVGDVQALYWLPDHDRELQEVDDPKLFHCVAQVLGLHVRAFVRVVFSAVLLHELVAEDRFETRELLLAHEVVVAVELQGGLALRGFRDPERSFPQRILLELLRETHGRAIQKLREHQAHRGAIRQREAVAVKLREDAVDELFFGAGPLATPGIDLRVHLDLEYAD